MITLPSGRQLVSVSASETQMKSESGAMSLDADGVCPKCKKNMGHALVGREKVFYCTTCRVSLPLKD